MKNFRLLIVLVLFTQLSIHSFGQLVNNLPPIPKKLSFNLGIKGGVNLSNISNNQENINFSPEMLPGFNAGLFANIHFGYRNEGSAVGTGWFGLQPEILFSRQGFTLNEESVNIINDNTYITSIVDAITLNYVTLPILLKLYLTKQLNIEAGPYFSYLIGVTPSLTKIDGAEITLSDLVGTKDAGIALGLGYETKVGLTINARFNLGLSDVASNLAWKNQVAAISLGYMF